LQSRKSFLQSRKVFLQSRKVFLQSRKSFLQSRKVFLQSRKVFCSQEKFFCSQEKFSCSQEKLSCPLHKSLSYNELPALRAFFGRIWGLFYLRFMFHGSLCELRVREQPEAAGASWFAAHSANDGC
jgi:hypothetical protein